MMESRSVFEINFSYPISTQKFDVFKTHHSPNLFGTSDVNFSSLSSLNCRDSYPFSLEKEERLNLWASTHETQKGKPIFMRLPW